MDQSSSASVAMSHADGASSGPGATRLLNDPTSATITQTVDAQSNPTLRLRLASNPNRTRAQRTVSWRQDTIDNEYLNKKKSKCCCIYQKPRNWDESSSEDENEDHSCQHCRGHRKSDYNHLKEKDPDHCHHDHDCCGGNHDHDDSGNPNENSNDGPAANT